MRKSRHTLELTENALNIWQTSSHSAAPVEPTRQKEWMKPIHAHIEQTLLSNTHKAPRYLGTCSTGSGDRVNVLPSRQLGLHLNNEEFQSIVAIRLGAKISNAYTCICGRQQR